MKTYRYNIILSIKYVLVRPKMYPTARFVFCTLYTHNYTTKLVRPCKKIKHLWDNVLLTQKFARIQILPVPRDPINMNNNSQN